jgi:Ribbon-helix-helix protein, copG family
MYLSLANKFFNWIFVSTLLYNMYMKENADKYLTIRIPETLMDKFKDKCAENYKTMSEALRDLIQEYIKRK